MTPSTPQTGSGRKQLTGQTAGEREREEPPQAPESESEGNFMMGTDRTAEKEQRMVMMKRVKRSRWDLGDLRSMVEVNPIIWDLIRSGPKR